MKLLRQTIRYLIKEGLYFDQLKDLALYEVDQRESKIYILFHPDLINEIIEADLDIDDLARSKNALAMMKVNTKRDFDRLCYNSWQVKLAGAFKGWGPTMYDIVMGDSPNGIMADRESVSDPAFDVWDFYYKNRNVEKKPLDWHEVAWTQEEEDDCDWGAKGDHWKYLNNWENHYDNWGNPVTLQSDPNIGHEEFLSDPLNWVYNRGPVPNREALRNNFAIAKQRIEDSDRFWVPMMWKKLASKMFDYSLTRSY